ncbi:ABC transporter permease [Paenibacillus polymyxa]|uniref:ABC transporter permease n=1 Tax=Paenibacillus polymyxa TaxID=1406 RepID=UPI0032B01F1E
MILRVIKAEGFKLKKICWWIPLIQGCVLTGMTAVEWYLYFRQGPGGVYAGFAVMFMFLSFVMLLGGTLLASIMAGTEHDTQTWKQLMAMPVPRSYIYLSKIVWIVILQLGTALITVAGMSLIWVLYTNEPIPWRIMLLQPINASLATLPVLAIQLWLSTLFTNQAFPLAFGIFGSIASLFLARTSILWIKILPWSYPALSSPLMKEHLIWVIVALSAGVIFTGLGTLQFTKHEFK